MGVHGLWWEEGKWKYRETGSWVEKKSVGDVGGGIGRNKETLARRERGEPCCHGDEGEGC